MTTPIIECRGVYKGFRGSPVLRGVDLDVHEGETLVILGASGSGKSVLLKHMNGLLQPDHGSVRVEGREISRLSERDLAPVRRTVGMLFQMAALFDSMTVYENVAFPIRQRRDRSEVEIRRRVESLLEVVGLAGTGKLLPAELSGGMRKRAGLARALALEPKALLYDEPTTGLDPVVAQRINLLIRDLRQRFGLTGVVVTHDLHSAFSVANRIAFLHEGSISFAGRPEELRATRDPMLREFLEAAA